MPEPEPGLLDECRHHSPALRNLNLSLLRVLSRQSPPHLSFPIPDSQPLSLSVPITDGPCGSYTQYLFGPERAPVPLHPLRYSLPLIPVDNLEHRFLSSFVFPSFIPLPIVFTCAACGLRSTSSISQSVRACLDHVSHCPNIGRMPISEDT